jgi:uncharacterized membrane protein YoaK (UPF0700 family)
MLLLQEVVEVVTAGGETVPGVGWTDTTIAVPELWVPAVALVIPVLTALVTRYRAPGQRLAYSFVSIVLAGVLAAVAALLDDVPDTIGGVATAFALAIVASVTSYALVWSGANREPGKGIDETFARGGIV